MKTKSFHMRIAEITASLYKTGYSKIFMVFVLTASLSTFFSCNNDKYSAVTDISLLYGENTYVGSKTCVQCHKEEYDKWVGSHHDLAMQVANDSTILGNFDDVKVTIDDIKYHFYKEDDKFFVWINEIDDSEKIYEITYAFGVTPLQQYMVDFDGGRKQVLRATWDSVENKWFHQYAGDTIEPNDWLHWTRGGQNWNTMCASCHSTNLIKNYHPDTDSFETTYNEINVACESCHGPSKHHNIWAEHDSLNEDLRIIKAIGQREQLNLCAPCHSRRTNFYDNLPLHDDFDNNYLVQNLGTNFYHGDGQIREEDYVYGSFLQSKMHANNVMCTNCHDAHTLKIKFEDNRLCTACHLPSDYDTKAHHFHTGGTEASLCINCHMTGDVYMGNDYRRDHSFRIPRPDQSEEYGTPNACIQCHTDKSNKWASTAITNWYGEVSKDDYSDMLLLSSKATLNQSEKRSLGEYVLDSKIPDIVRATIVENINFFSEEDFKILYKALNDTSPKVRYQALLKFSGLPPQITGPIVLKHMKDSVKLVRMGVARLALGVDSNNFNESDKRQLTTTLEEYKEMLYANADFPAGRLQLGDYYSQKSVHNTAIKHYNMALKMDSLLIPVYSNLATSYSILKDYDKANLTLDEWIKREPKQGRPHYLKGLLHFEMGDNDTAVSELELAIKLDPADTRSMYNLSTYWYQNNTNLAKAERYAKEALRIEPFNQNYKYLLALVYQKRGKTELSNQLMRELQPNQ